jgi:polyisoprenoid-binding protein YceI
MNNSYIVAGVIVLAAILGFVLASKKTEAPVALVPNNNATSTEVVFSDGTYKLDISSSQVLWQGEFLTGLKENGTVKFQSGDFELENSIIKSGQFVVDMNTIDSTPFKERLVNHLKNDDFFSVEKYPTSTFVLKSMAPSSENGAKMGRYVLAGDLTIRGITKPISLIATITQDPANPDILIAKSSMAINRADWEIKYNSATFFQNLGDKIIRDAVVLELDLKAQKVLQ